MNSRARPLVALTFLEPTYPQTPPYSPSEPYPEYGARPLGPHPNPVYAAVRTLLRDLGYDRDRFGTPDWNPLAGLVRQGDRVFIKPNLVSHEFRRVGGRNGDLFSVITHPSAVRAIADYVALALRGTGEIVIGDNPSIDARFDQILARTHLDALPTFYAAEYGARCRVLDLRPEMTLDLADYGFKSRTTKLAGDPEGSTVLDLGKNSCLYGLNPLLFRGVFTDRVETILHHFGATQQYSLSNSVLNADVYISVPKLKAHHKVGTTLNVKGLVGINSNKNYLVHWRIGYPCTGGDEYPHAHKKRDVLRLGLRHAATDILPEAWYLGLRRRCKGGLVDRLLEPTKLKPHERFRGAWDGNDTIWRMTADLYMLFVADAIGWRRGRRTRFLSVVDGVLGGEGDGPFSPTARAAGVLIGGEDLLLVDSVATRLMDYDLRQIRYLQHLLAATSNTTLAFDVIRDGIREPATSFFASERTYLRFAPPSGWPRLAMHDGGTR